MCCVKTKIETCFYLGLQVNRSHIVPYLPCKKGKDRLTVQSISLMIREL
jgi:hypothetical protein